jgi:hypothetical protein
MLIISGGKFHNPRSDRARRQKHFSLRTWWPGGKTWDANHRRFISFPGDQ